MFGFHSRPRPATESAIHAAKKPGNFEIAHVKLPGSLLAHRRKHWERAGSCCDPAIAVIVSHLVQAAQSPTPHYCPVEGNTYLDA